MPAEGGGVGTRTPVCGPPDGAAKPGTLRISAADTRFTFGNESGRVVFEYGRLPARAPRHPVVWLGWCATWPTESAPQESAVDLLLVLVIAVLASGVLVGAAWAVRQARRAGRRRARVVLAGLVGALTGLVGAALLVGFVASLYWLINVIRVFL